MASGLRDTDAPVGRRDFVHQAAGSIRASVVEEQDLVIRESAIDRAMDLSHGFDDVSFFVEGGDYYGDRRHGLGHLVPYSHTNAM